MDINSTGNSTDGFPVRSDGENSLLHFDYTNASPSLQTPARIDVNVVLVSAEQYLPPVVSLPLVPVISSALPPPPSAPMPSPSPLSASPVILPPPSSASPMLVPPPLLASLIILSPPPSVPPVLVLLSPPPPSVTPLLIPPPLSVPQALRSLTPSVPTPPVSLSPPPPPSTPPMPTPPPLPVPPLRHPLPPLSQSPNNRQEPSWPPVNINSNKNEGRRSWDIDFINDMFQWLGNKVDVNLGVDSKSRSKPLIVPYTPGEFDCNKCYNMRDISHTNGTNNVRITLHGGNDVFNHLLIQIDNFRGDSVRLEHYYLDLSSHSYAWTKWLLVLYTRFLKEEGVAITMDTTSSFYENIENGGVNRDAAGPSNAAPQPRPPRPRARSRSRSKAPKTGLALQRERASQLTNDDLSPYFNGGIALAARELGLCSTAIKHACRRLGILRWPSRKLNSISKQINKHQKEMAALPPGDPRRHHLNMIKKLNTQYQRLMNGEPELVEACDGVGAGGGGAAGEEKDEADDEGSHQEGKDGGKGGKGKTSS